MLYFAYGSNMSTRRLQGRTPSATPLGVGVLHSHLMKFHKISGDGSGKCDAFETGDANDCMHGVVYRINEAEIETLDIVEELGRGYEKKQASITVHGRERLEAFTYCAISTDASLSPYCWYKEHVVRGAEEHGLPRDYTAALRAIRHLDDHDAVRIARELSIYRND